MRITNSAQHLTSPKYRADIDGLRAIAVLSVVACHAFPFTKMGGFIGVDIFFVISGFLISSIIFSNLERNSFSFLEFYSRRIRRIFPALILVLVASYVFGWFALFAEEYQQLGKHMAGGATYISNFVLWRESGYFDNIEQTKPLMHLWSLAIEEQFYIFWPLLLAYVWKRKWSFVAITAVVGFISFVFNIYLINRDPVEAFYFPISRFWELMIGGLLAYIALHKPHLIGKGKDLQSFLGVFLLVFGLIFINRDRLFPGWYALLPTFAAFFMISAGPEAWFNKHILSNKILVWFGLISYPLYLWHWPLLSYAHIIEGQVPTREMRGAAVLVSIVFAWMTYKFIEKPIRFGNQNKLTAIMLLIFLGIVGCLGYSTYLMKGLPFRSAAQVSVVNFGDTGEDIFFKYIHEKFYLCTPDKLRNEAPSAQGLSRCFQSQKSDDKKIAIIGDSRAEELFPGLADVLLGTNVVYYNKSLPFINNKEFENIFKYVLNDPKIATIILSADWKNRLREIPRGSSLEIELDRTVKVLAVANKKIYIADNPDFSFDAKKCKYDKNIFRQHRCTEDINTIIHDRSVYYPTLESIARNNPNVNFLNLDKYFCSKSACSMAKNGILLYRDNVHVNVYGSIYVAKRIIHDNPLLAVTPPH